MDTAISRTPVSEGLIRRAITGLKYAVTGKRPEWFGPQEPLTPVAPPGNEGRAFDYPVGVNMQYQPRSGEPITFGMMRALADNYDLLRMVIETRKDQIVKCAWQIKPKEGEADNPAAAKEITSCLRFPDRFHSWQQWIRMLLEDMLVIDAATIYPRKTIGGKMYSLDVVDGSTIKVLADQTGRPPLPPAPAYQQIIKGLPATEYQWGDIFYYPRNVRSNKFYGFSPVEQIIMTVNIALRRQKSQLNFYTEGTIPDALIGVPDEWTAQQIKEFQAYFDALLGGNLADRRKARFVPGGFKPYFTKEQLLKDEMDEWLARVICFAFSLPPTAFVRQVNRATAQTTQETALSEGLMPLLIWIKDMMDYIIMTYFDRPELEFAWKQDKDIDPQVQAQIDDIYIRNGTLSVDEVRDREGLDPIGMGNAIYTASGAVPIDTILSPPGPVEGGPGSSGKGGDAENPDDMQAMQKTFMAEAIAKGYRLGLL